MLLSPFPVAAGKHVTVVVLDRSKDPPLVRIKVCTTYVVGLIDVLCALALGSVHTRSFICVTMILYIYKNPHLLCLVYVYIIFSFFFHREQCAMSCAHYKL